jgi:hypothetical protein
MATTDGRSAVASLAAISFLLITLNTARPAPFHGIDPSAIAEASLVRKVSDNQSHPSSLQLLVAKDPAPWHTASYMRLARLK